MTYTKVIYLLWAPRRQSKQQTQTLLLQQAAPRLLAIPGVLQLAMHLADPAAKTRSPAPRLTREPPIAAEVSVWLADQDAWRKLEAELRGLGFQSACYLVEETLYTDYGENRHAAPRDWPDGQRSPGIVTVNLLDRPARLTPEQWLARWHGTMTPVSEAIQPRSRYVRNAVVRALSAQAPRCDAIVEEAWPSKRHVENPLLFYGAASVWQLPRNLLAILRAVRSFVDIRRVRTVATSEYLLKTDPRLEPARRSPYDVAESARESDEPLSGSAT